MRRFGYCLALIGFLNICSSAHAADTRTHYLDPASLPPIILPVPAAEGSAEWQKQIVQVINAQQKVSDADLYLIRNEQYLRIDLITGMLGRNFTPENLPKTFELLDHVFNDAMIITNIDKQYWHIRRPYLTDTRVKLLIDPLDASPAYPSGHTSSLRVVAEVVGMLCPNQMNMLRMRSEDIAMHRIQAGVHYPNDIVAGRALAILVLATMLQRSDFNDDLRDAQAEIAAVNGCLLAHP